MEKIKHFFGMRKTKTLIALVVCFALWLLIRLFLPSLEPFPMYAFLYAIIEMRNSIATEKRTSMERIKINIIGFIVAFGAIALRDALWNVELFYQNAIIVEFVIILVGVLLSINAAEWVKCKTLCGLAATTFIICFWHTTYDPYFYATLRFVQTLLGLGVALLVNLLIFPPKDEPKA